MRPIPQEEVHGILLNILKAFQKYCKMHSIKLLLSGGTALGAVRHKGFIPWDDDIDLYIFNDGFDKLMVLAVENPFIDDEKRYKILVPGKYPNVYPFFKVIDTKTIVYERNISKKYATGLWIDVFCLSFWAEGIDEAYRQFKKQQFYKRMNMLIIGGNYHKNKYKLIEVLVAPVRFILLSFGMNSEYWCKKILSLNKYRMGKHMGDICWPRSFQKEYYKSEWFTESIEIPFEDIICLVPKEHDKVLKNFYGKYMTLPPIEQRVRHNPEAYYSE